MLVVLDANIFVSAAIGPTSIARALVQAGIAGRFDYAVCPTLLGEVVTALGRPKISRLLPDDAAARFVVDVQGRAQLEPDPPNPPRASRDSRDDYLVALAVSAGADAVVTGDADLLDISDPPVSIMRLRSFADALGLESMDN